MQGASIVTHARSIDGGLIASCRSVRRWPAADGTRAATWCLTAELRRNGVVCVCRDSDYPLPPLPSPLPAITRLRRAMALGSLLSLIPRGEADMTDVTVPHPPSPFFPPSPPIPPVTARRPVEGTFPGRSAGDQPSRRSVSDDPRMTLG